MSEPDCDVNLESISAILGTSLSENTAYVRFIRNGEFEHPNKTHNVRYCICCVYNSESEGMPTGPYVYDIYPKGTVPEKKTFFDIMHIIKYQIYVLMRIYQGIRNFDFSKELWLCVYKTLYSFIFGKDLWECIFNMDIEKLEDVSQYELITDEEILNSTHYCSEDANIFNIKTINVTEIKDMLISPTITIHQASAISGNLEFPEIIMCTTTRPVHHEGFECEDLVNYYMVFQILDMYRLINSTFNAILNNGSFVLPQDNSRSKDVLLANLIRMLNIIMFEFFVSKSVPEEKNRLLTIFNDMLCYKPLDGLCLETPQVSCRSEKYNINVVAESYKYDLRIVNPND